MPETYRLGKDCVFETQTDGVSGSAGWNEVVRIEEATLTLDSESVQFATRESGGWQGEAPVVKTAEFSFTMIWEPGSDARFNELSDAYDALGSIGCRILDGPVDGEFTKGLIADMVVKRFSRPEPVNNIVKAEVTMAPAIGTTPQWVKAGPDYTP